MNNQAAVQNFQADQQDACYTGNILVSFHDGCVIYQELDNDIVIDMSE